MGRLLKKFEEHWEYEDFVYSGEMERPNVSYCVLENEVHYNPIVDFTFTGYFNVTDTSTPTVILGSTYGSPTTYEGIDGLEKILIDGEIEVLAEDIYNNNRYVYQFTTTGTHSIKYYPKPEYEGKVWVTALSDCNDLVSVEIGNGITEINAYAFGYCYNLSSVTIPDGVTVINSVAFTNCRSLTNITIPSGVTSIGDRAFEGCSGLTSVNIPDGITVIPYRAFMDCRSLTSITIPSGVTYIGEEAFRQCSGLTSITSLKTTAPTIDNNTFINVKTNGTLYVPAGSTGYDRWMGTGNYYLGKYGWAKVEQ